MKLITLIRGLPGSGKSTLARALSLATNAVHWETDDFFVIGDQYQWNPTQLKDAHAWCQQRVRNAMMSQEDVIVSNTFVKRWEMMPYLHMAREFDYEVNIIECKGTFKNVHGVPIEKIEQMRANWENWENLL